MEGKEREDETLMEDFSRLGRLNTRLCIPGMRGQGGSEEAEGTNRRTQKPSRLTSGNFFFV